MDSLLVMALLVVVFVYMVAVLFYIRRQNERHEVDIIMQSEQRKRMKTFHYEDVVMQSLRVEPDKVRYVLYLERVLVVSCILSSFFIFRGLAMVAFGATFICLASNDAYKKVVYESGIENIEKVTNFINYFVPHINSGNSADQSLLGYIDYSADEELAEYYENRNNAEYKIPVHLQQIVDIYDIAKYNEEQGISNYTYILNELNEDMAQKQVYYNSFVSRMGEIKPIMWSYYIGVPILIVISFGQTYDFWMGGGGYIVAVALLVMFGLFKFLIFKLQKKTINVIF